MIYVKISSKHILQEEGVLVENCYFITTIHEAWGGVLTKELLKSTKISIMSSSWLMKLTKYSINMYIVSSLINVIESTIEALSSNSVSVVSKLVDNKITALKKIICVSARWNSNCIEAKEEKLFWK